MVGLEGYPLDDLEDASVIADEYRYLKKDMEKVLKGPDKDWRKGTVWEKNNEEK
jgi:hypothetical protein